MNDELEDRLLRLQEIPDGLPPLEWDAVRAAARLGGATHRDQATAPRTTQRASTGAAPRPAHLLIASRLKRGVPARRLFPFVRLVGGVVAVAAAIVALVAIIATRHPQTDPAQQPTTRRAVGLSAPTASFSALRCAHPVVSRGGPSGPTLVDATRLCPLATVGTVAYYIAPARTAGSICLIAAPAPQSLEANLVTPVTCTTTRIAAAAGIVSAALPTAEGHVRIAAILPDGYTTMRYGTATSAIRNNFVSALLPRPERVTFTGPSVRTITSKEALPHHEPGIAPAAPPQAVSRIQLGSAARARVSDIGGVSAVDAPRRGSLGPAIALPTSSGNAIVAGDYTSLSGHWCIFDYLADPTTLTPLLAVGRSCSTLTAPPTTLYWSSTSGAASDPVRWASGVAPRGATSIQITTSTGQVSRQEVLQRAGRLFIVETGTGDPVYIEAFTGSRRILTLGSPATSTTTKPRPLRPNTVR